MAKTFADDIEKISYAMGMNMGEYSSHLPLDIKLELVGQGLKDFAAGVPALDPEEYSEAMQLLQKLMQEAGQKKAQEAGAANAKAESDFLSANKGKEGVKVTSSGLQYSVLTEGTGSKPTKDSTVRVHYTGKLLDGTVFDSSVERGEPAEFGVGQVIAGWTEALQLMAEGSKYRLFIPAALAYGERGAANVIPPNSALIFDVELLKVL